MKLLLAQLFIFSSLICVGQTQSNDWEYVQVFEFEKRGSYPDSLEICGGEWLIKGNANSVEELNEKELERIKKKVAKKGCNVVYIDTRKVYRAFPGKLYILGLKG